jgi:hypothetical protein
MTINDIWLEAFINKIPEFLNDTKSFMLYLQKCGDLGDHVVLNGISMGYGAFYSRFCSIYGEEDNFVTRSAIEALNENYDLNAFYDLNAVLGVNTNLHPFLFKNMIEYPGCVSPGNKEYNVIKLNELLICADDMRHCLILIHKKTGQPIQFRPLNFLFPGVGPSLYRFLYLFTPFINLNGGFWRDYIKLHRNDKVSVLPRLQLGNLVLDRKTWVFPPSQLPQYIEPQKNFYQCMTTLRRWCSDYDIPEFVFYRQAETIAGGDNWILAMKQHLKFGDKSKKRKPHFLDFKNPMLIKIFLKHMEEKSNNTLILQEALPQIKVRNEENIFTKEDMVQVNVD